MSIANKKTLGIFSFTSCEGCQFELLGHYDLFSKLLNFYEIKNFRLGQEESNDKGGTDVSVIEGSPEGKSQIDHLKIIRQNSKIIIAIGACAHLGGIQSQRNSLPNKLINKKDVVSVSDIIKTDYVVPGCPISQKELIDCLIDVYYERKFILPDLAVCYECKLNENQCLIKNGKPCLGPITRAGCDSVCVNSNEACLGCRGPLEQANFAKLKETLKPMLTKEELVNWLNIYGDYEKEHERKHI